MIALALQNGYYIHRESKYLNPVITDVNILVVILTFWLLYSLSCLLLYHPRTLNQTFIQFTEEDDSTPAHSVFHAKVNTGIHCSYSPCYVSSTEPKVGDFSAFFF